LKREEEERLKEEEEQKKREEEAKQNEKEKGEDNKDHPSSPTNLSSSLSKDKDLKQLPPSKIPRLASASRIPVLKNRAGQTYSKPRDPSEAKRSTSPEPSGPPTPLSLDEVPEADPEMDEQMVLSWKQYTDIKEPQFGSTLPNIVSKEKLARRTASSPSFAFTPQAPNIVVPEGYVPIKRVDIPPSKRENPKPKALKKPTKRDEEKVSTPAQEVRKVYKASAVSPTLSIF
jgi:hypothetical protein